MCLKYSKMALGPCPAPQAQESPNLPLPKIQDLDRVPDPSTAITTTHGAFCDLSFLSPNLKSKSYYKICDTPIMRRLPC